MKSFARTNRSSDQYTYCWFSDKRKEALKNLVELRIHRLFHLYLQSLRDYFGRYYEFLINESVSSKESDWNLRTRKVAWLVEERFTKAALIAIPQICRHPGGELSDEFSRLFDCAEVFRGLQEDVEEITAAHNIDQSEWKDLMDENEEEESTVTILPSRIGLRQLIKRMKAKIQRRGPGRWYERLAAKVVVLSVNYVQGWIVLRALRREAEKRDMEMPKFPLF